jgi:hypothetical protein
MPNFKEITREGKTQKLAKTQELLAPGRFTIGESKYPIIYNISLFYDLVEHHVSPILQKI